MSITAETAKAHANDPAVLCCRAEGGITIEPANLEDPAIFDELVDSGLLNLDGCLKIGQVLGAKLTKTSDSLCPLTADNVEGFKSDDDLAAEEAPAGRKPVPERTPLCVGRAAELYRPARPRADRGAALGQARSSERAVGHPAFRPPAGTPRPLRGTCARPRWRKAGQAPDQALWIRRRNARAIRCAANPPPERARQHGVCQW